MNGKDRHFGCKLEYRFAQWLNFLKDVGYIREWDYENEDCKFFFENVEYGSPKYTIDFVVYHHDDRKEYYETKGELQGPHVTKFRRLREQQPDIVINLAVMTIPKKHRGRFVSASRFVDRIIQIKKEKLFDQVPNMDWDGTGDVCQVPEKDK